MFTCHLPLLLKDQDLLCYCGNTGVGRIPKLAQKVTLEKKIPLPCDHELSQPPNSGSQQRGSSFLHWHFTVTV